MGTHSKERVEGAEKNDPADGRRVVCGEIVLSANTAAREAKSRRHDFEAEMALYALHGLLHLLGYDDHSPEDAKRMHRMEDRILSELGLGKVYQSAGS